MFRAALFSALLVAVSCGVARGGDAERPAAAQSAATIEAAALVGQLGDDEFAVREAAGRALLKMELAAESALRGGLDNPDLEIRHRSRRLLDIVIKQDRLVRLAAFAADTDDKTDHRLPGWARFRETLGSDKTARELFVAMQRAEPELLRLADAGSKQTPDAFHARGVEMQMLLYGPYQQQVSLGSVATFLFIGSDASLKLADEATLPVYNFVNHNAFQQAIGGGPQTALMRKLLGGWITHRQESLAIYQNLHLALRFDLKEGLEPALSVVRRGADPNQLQMALLAVGKLGTADNMADLQPVLDNKTICSTYQVDQKTISTEVRDVALAVLVRMAGQKHADYGFDRMQTNPQTLFNVHTLGFDTNQRRDAALGKWAAWVVEHKSNLSAQK